jgi:hypothetical protein
MRLPLLACASLLVSACATAQEPKPVTWQSDLGRVTYASESGGAGVLEYPVAFGDNIGRLYVTGMAGERGGPGPLEGYWSEPDVSHDDEDDDTLICPFTIEDDHGRKTRNWGRIQMMFMGDDFPNDFMLLRGRCFEAPHEAVPGKLER